MDIDGLEINSGLQNLDIEDVDSIRMLNMALKTGLIKLEEKEDGSDEYTFMVEEEFNNDFVNSLANDIIIMNRFATDGVLMWFIYKSYLEIMKEPRLMGYWLKCMFICISAINKDMDNTLISSFNSSLAALSCGSFNCMLVAVSMFGNCVLYKDFIGEEYDECLLPEMLVKHYNKGIKKHYYELVNDEDNRNLLTVVSIARNVYGLLGLDLLDEVHKEGLVM